MSPKERSARAKQLLDDQLVKDVLAEMERRAVDDFVSATRWWWGDRRRRIAAEHVREVRDFRRRLEMAIVSAPSERIRSIA